MQFFKRGGITSLGARDTREYRKAMKEYKKENPFCAYCGRSLAVDVHHKLPVSVAPERAADKQNMITLCRKPKCHLIVGHMGNYKMHNSKVEEICKTMDGKK